MWGGTGPGPDPGGTEGGDRSTGSSSNQELIDLKDQFEQQQVLIAQLKEMLRKTEQKTVTEEKVEEYANTLTRMSARVKKSRMKRAETADESIIDTPASEKIMLLRQQLEENKLRLAQRGKFQKGIEESVTQLKAQFDDSQQLISQTPLNLSLTDTKNENYSIESTSEELFNLLVNKDRKLSELNNKIQKLEANVIDLQENLKEKDSVIDARTKAITLMTESLSRKGKNTLDALDDTKEQMRKMQENFVALEMEMKAEKQGLLNELDNKNAFITTLQDSYYVLQNAHMQAQSEIETYKAKLATSTTGDTEPLSNRINDLENELLQKSADLDSLIKQLKQKDSEIQHWQQMHSSSQEDCNKLLNEIGAMRNNSDLNNQTLKSRVMELEELNLELTKSSSEAISPRDSPQRSSKKGKRGSKGVSKLKDNVELQKLLDQAKEECEQYRMKLVEHDLTIQELNLIITDLKNKEEEVVEKPDDVVKLKKQLEDSNKNMIKIKAQHKSKIKELNKKIDELKNSGDDKEKFVEIQKENSKLREQIDGLVKENERLISNSVTDSASNERIKELEAQLFEQSELLDTKNQSLDTLEAQLKTYKTELSSLSERFNKLSQVENDQVASEMTSIHFEEQLDNLQLEKNALEERNHIISLEKESLLEKIETVLKEKQEITVKLENYMQENMDLIDKLEKLSAEKVSSAESIEIVEGLTQQEKLELEAYQQSLELVSGTMTDNIQTPELNESVNQLTEETCDLLQKIELFTEERREVMEKMEALAAENNQLNMKLQEIENNRDILSETYEQLQNEKEVIEQERNTLKLLEVELMTEITQLKKENEILKMEMKQEGGSTFEAIIPLESDEQRNNELQKQIDEYRSLIEIQKSEISELKVELLSHKDLPAANRELHEKITALQKEYETILSENEKLSKTLKEQSEIVQEKQDLERELIEAKKRIDDFGNKLEENLTELENYKSIIEDNKEELISSSNIIADLQNKVQAKQNEVSHYQNEVSHLNSVIAELNSALSHLESENQKQNDYTNTIDVMSHQLQELKILLNENIDQIETYQDELQQNSITITKLNTQLKELNNKLLNMEHELQCQNDEILKLVKERDNKELMISNLQAELKDKEDTFHKMCQSLNEKYVSLQHQIEKNAGSLDKLSKVEELETKNKEQLEKMKKIAANLKKKTAAYAELQEKYNEVTNTLHQEEAARSQLKLTVEEQESKIKSLLEQFQDVDEEYKRAREELSLKTSKLNALTHEIADLRVVYEELQGSKQQFETQLHALRTESEMLSSNESNRLNMEINEKNEIIKNLNQQLDDVHYHAEINTNASQAKMQAMEMIIENQEADLTKYKDKVNNLQEIVSAIEERRLSLEKKTVELGEQLLEKSNSYEEISEAEDMLEQRLAALMQHDEQIGNRLHVSLTENQDLNERNQRLLDENEQLKHHLSAATEKNLEFSFNLEQLTQMQYETTKQREVITDLETQLRHMHEDYEKKLKNKTNEIESLESELQSQLQLLEDERKSLLVQCEQLQDQLKEHTEQDVLLKNGIEEYKQKLDQQQVDFEEHIRQFEKLNEENKHNLGVIEECSTNCERLKNENEELKNVITLMNNEAHENQKYRVDIEGKLRELERLNLELHEHNSKLSEEIREKLIPQEEIIHENPQPISTFVWPSNTNNDPFDFFTKPKVINEPLVQRNKEPVLETVNLDKDDCLLNKIKTLEFLLYNTEKEKEDVLSQCQELTNEIAHLIYEKHSVSAEPKPMDYFTKVDDSSLCKKCKSPKAHQSQSDLDLEIVSSKQTAITQTDLEQLQKLEFEKVKPFVEVPNLGQPIVEDVCESKIAYVCHPEIQPIVEDEVDRPKQSINFEAFGENDDGWGCGADEAKLEEDYRQKMGSSMLHQNLNFHVEELDEKVRSLELERERHLEEIKQLQIKSGKLIKKLKEFKLANDKLSADLRRSDFGGLDDAIQDELKQQVDRLEKRIKETNVELQKEKSEKMNLLQKVQNLQTTNDRMAEAKEKHDVDFIVLQRQNRELMMKLEQFEWGNVGYDSPVHAKEVKTLESGVPADVLEKNVRELNETIKELSLDNEELLMLLEEQRTLRINAEKSKSAEPMMENMKTEAEYLLAVADVNKLNDQLVHALEEKRKVEEELVNIVKAKEELQSNLNRLMEEKNEMAQIQLTLQKQNEKLESQVSLSSNELELSKHQITELSERISLLDKDLQAENDRLVEVNTSLVQLQENNRSLLEQLQLRDGQLLDMSTVLTANQNKTSEMENWMQQSEDLDNENKRLSEQLQLKNAEILEMSARLQEAVVQRATYEASLQQLADEWNQRVDQRGLDVAESWKLHLEAQETEFMQIQKQLRKEIQDLEEKCNALDNENNELRRNVDAEIRNEVDKISALQQQINNRQVCINELSQTLQETQAALSDQQQKNINYEASVSQLSKKIEEKDAELSQLHDLIGTLKSDIEAQKIYVVELTQKLDAADTLQRQLDEYISMNNKLKQELTEIQQKHVEACAQMQDELKQELSEIQEKHVEACAQIQDNNATITQLTNRLSEIDSLRQSDVNKINHLETHIQGLTLELQEKVGAIEFLNNQINYYTQQSSDTEQKDLKIKDLTNEITRLNGIVEELEKGFSGVTSSEQIKDNKISELFIETNNLKLLLGEKEKEYSYQLEAISQENLQRQSELKSSYDKLLLTKDYDLEILSIQIQELAQNNEAFNSILKERDVELNELKILLDSKVKECDALNNKLYEEETLHTEENKQVVELGKIIEDQVLKIESLKQELFGKSKDYDSLIAELDLRKPSSEQRQTYQINRQAESSRVESAEDDNIIEPITHAELDLALYMLHQRDVRCEELTVELMQLLEERDTLQLKLSNAIREKEELKRKYLPDLMSESISEEMSKSTNVTPVKQTVTTSGIDTGESSEGDLLTNKLSELKSVGYQKDKTRVDERDQRRLLQMSLMQQHREIASMLPPEAAARLVQEASYTLSRQVQSPSKVLLNWLWGKSTPKVNDI
ncbi:hypothetical protein RN001_003594 [Aquatica leii]|uniref:Uncharacterized protein n=1 Tax=Aquatica leii TaxID=1421715 RepID=A0AAN7SRN0_9COLE|nr:hypothetical protein RN001_003594 [Aquatica leii]